MSALPQGQGHHISLHKRLLTHSFFQIADYSFHKDRVLMDYSPIRQTFRSENNFSAVGKSFLNLAKLGNLVVKYQKMSKI